MFTGIIEELGTVIALDHEDDGVQLRLRAPETAPDVGVGASIAVNGCCLSATAAGEDWWEAYAVPETLARTTLGALAVGDVVNLERPARAGASLDGHVVQGHVDGVGRVTKRTVESDGSLRLGVALPADLAAYVVEKGSIALDGVSLTVTSVTPPETDPPTVGVAIIPHTASVTTLGRRREGDDVNVEVDVLGKYVERLLATRERI